MKLIIRYMKYYILIVVLLLSFFGGCSPIRYCCFDDIQQDALVKILNKRDDYGYIIFLQKNNDSYKELTFSYAYDRRKNKFCCHKHEEEDVITIDDRSKEGWFNADMCREGRIYSAKFHVIFRYISEDFINLSNDEKIIVLEKLAEKDN